MPAARRSTSTALALALGLAAVLPAAANPAGGLTADAESLAWGRMQTRIAYSASPPWAASLASDGGAGLKVSGLALMGDVYLSPTRATALAGFRATSGLLMGTRTALWGTRTASGGGLLVVDRRSTALAAPGVHAAADLPDDHSASTMPYVGIGYSSLPSRAGWSFTADLGMVSRAPGNVVRFGRVFSGNQNLDDVVRDLRLAPVLQLGVTYAF